MSAQHYNDHIMTRDRGSTQISEALEGYPRCELGACPTPLIPLERLSRKVGRRILLKRDDILGPAAGGNKTRKLEYLLADALKQGTFRTDGRTGDECNGVAAFSEPFAGNERVFLCAAENQPSYDVYDFHFVFSHFE